MKVRANCTINHNGTWHRPGAEFEVSDAEALALGSAVSIFVTEPVAKQDGAELPRRGRKRKTDNPETE